MNRLCARALGYSSATYPTSIYSVPSQLKSCSYQLRAAAVLRWQPARCTGFFCNLTGEQLWKGVTSVSNAGRKRGRSRGLMRKRDLNRGQSIGSGRVAMLWPGLNAEPVRGQDMVRQRRLPDDPEREEKLLKVRQQQSSFKPMRLGPLERGWSGNRLPGRSLGPPEPVDFEPIEGFDVTCLELKNVTTVTAVAGRVRHVSCFGVAGNQQGLIGLGLGKGNTPAAAVAQCRRRSLQKLMYIERCDEHTVLHDFFTRFNNSKIFVERRARGHGLVCHRVIREICLRVGITDLYAKVEGSSDNVQSISKAFVLGLLRQRTHQQLADEKRLHLVEIHPDSPQYPRVRASPRDAPARCDAEVPPDENTDFQLHIFEGKVPLKRPWLKPYFTTVPTYQVHLNRIKHLINQDEVRVRLLAEYGELRSFLADKHPECRASWHTRKKRGDEEQTEY